MFQDPSTSPDDAQSLLVDMGAELNAVEKDVAEFEVLSLLGGPYDKGGALLTIMSGAGGVEAQDWANMLYRMYRRCATPPSTAEVSPGGPRGGLNRVLKSITVGPARRVDVCAVEKALRPPPLPTKLRVKHAPVARQITVALSPTKVLFTHRLGTNNVDSFLLTT